MHSFTMQKPVKQFSAYTNDGNLEDQNCLKLMGLLIREASIYAVCMPIVKAGDGIIHVLNYLDSESPKQKTE